MDEFKVYPSKRVKNHAAKKLRKIFGITGTMVIKHAPSIVYEKDKCYGLCFSEGYKDKALHRIVIAEDINSDLKSYMSTLLHEYVHAWQYENDIKLGHCKKSKFHAWKKYLLETQNVSI